MKKVLPIVIVCFLMVAGSPATSLQAQQLITPELSREMALENNKQMVIAAGKREMASYEV